ncbi:MAG: ATP-binding protein [Anaerolineales bacterium]|nr:ATP-binding protein [Anaerolineales bacterium]MCB0027452.1 ATP-binding protein [Anaerolineales bacterium]
MELSKRRIPRRLSAAIINSLSAGVTPRIGLEHINVGRRDEIEALLEDLDNVAEKGGAFRFIIGRYGSGKTFLLQLFRNQAMDRGFVVADADLSPQRRFTSSSDAGLATYRELMNNLAMKTKPDGGALSSIIERWISGIQSRVRQTTNLAPDEPAFQEAVEEEIYAVIDNMEGMVHGFDFARVLSTYWEGHCQLDDERKSVALRWLRGEFTTKTEAHQSLGVRVIITDEDWYDYIKLLATFVAQIGYKGLILFIDEAVNLYKISHTVSRNTNYEKLLTMFNDTMQGKAQSLGILVGGTPSFLEDQRRGLYSYEALETRLSTSRFSQDGLKDVSGPVIRLQILDPNAIFTLLTRILEVYIAHYSHDPNLSVQDLQAFLQAIASRLGTEQLLTPREVVRDFITVLNLLRQNPDSTFQKIIGSDVFQPTKEHDPDVDEDSDYAEFSL